MSIVTLPTGIVASQKWGFNTYGLKFVNGDTGSQQNRILGPQRWSVVLGSDSNLNRTQAALWRQLLLSMKGGVNQLAMPDLANLAPQGTMRGTMTLHADAAAGASSISVIAGTEAGKTLCIGDWLSVSTGTGSQLLHSQANATADGSGIITFTFEPVLRYAYSAGTSVVWNAPTALMRMQDNQTVWNAAGSTQDGFILNLLESWEN